MEIRPVTAADKEEWLRMRLALWPDSSTAEELPEIEQYLAAPARPSPPAVQAAFICFRPEGGCCGLVEVSIRHEAPGCETDRIGYLEAWYVDPDWRGRGAGRALVAAAEKWARAAGCREMASDTTPAYPGSPAAHNALGYMETARFFRKTLTPAS